MEPEVDYGEAEVYARFQAEEIRVSYAQASQDLGVHTSQLRDWVRTEELDGAWATIPRCKETFVKRGNAFVLSERTDSMGAGLSFQARQSKKK